MTKEDTITGGILGGSLLAAILIALASLLAQGCVSGCKANGPIVHPTDEQIENGAKGGETKDPPYVPWWAEEGN